MIYNSHRFDGGESMSIQPVLQFPLGRRELAGHPRVPLAGHIHGFGKRLEQGLHDMVGLIPVKQRQVQVATGLIGKTLEELPGQAEAERAGHILSLLSLTDRKSTRLNSSHLGISY